MFITYYQNKYFLFQYSTKIFLDNTSTTNSTHITLVVPVVSKTTGLIISIQNYYILSTQIAFKFITLLSSH